MIESLNNLSLLLLQVSPQKLQSLQHQDDIIGPTKEKEEHSCHDKEKMETLSNANCYNSGINYVSRMVSSTDVRNWCQRCGVCATRKNPNPKRRAALRTSSWLPQANTDIPGPLPDSDNGKSYILVVGDYYTRSMEAYTIPNQEATIVATKLVDEHFFRFCTHEQLHSNQEKQFEGNLIAEICKLLHINKTRTYM